jgi:hypothetical protein
MPIQGHRCVGIRGILSTFGGFPSGFRRSHRWSHAVVRVPSFAPWSLILVRNKARHLASISSSSRPPSSLLCCRVDIGTQNIVPFQMNHIIAFASYLTCSFEMGKFVLCAIFWRVGKCAHIEFVE